MEQHRVGRDHRAVNARPQAGTWSGLTEQERSNSFEGADSPRCEIVAGSLRVQERDSCGYVTTAEFHDSFPVTDSRFDTKTTQTLTHAAGDLGGVHLQSVRPS